MNLKEAAEKLNISETTARRWVKVGRLEAHKENGAYGLEYIVSPAAIDKAKAMNRTPVIIQSNEPTVTVEDMQRMINNAIQQGIVNHMQSLIEEGNQTITDEVQALKTDLQAIRIELAAERDKDRRQIEERDKRLMETLRLMQEARTQPQRKSWKDIFRK